MSNRGLVRRSKKHSGNFKMYLGEDKQARVQSRGEEDVLEREFLNLIEVRGHSAYDVRRDGGFEGRWV